MNLWLTSGYFLQPGRRAYKISEVKRRNTLKIFKNKRKIYKNNFFFRESPPKFLTEQTYSSIEFIHGNRKFSGKIRF